MHKTDLQATTNLPTFYLKMFLMNSENNFNDLKIYFIPKRIGLEYMPFHRFFSVLHYNRANRNFRFIFLLYTPRGVLWSREEDIFLILSVSAEDGEEEIVGRREGWLAE